jgi:hypothetical protein
MSTTPVPQKPQPTTQMSFADRSFPDTVKSGSSSSQSTRQGSSTDPYALTRIRQDAPYSQRTADLTAEALGRLDISNDTSSGARQTRGLLRRRASLTPSVTSVSTGPDEEDGRPSSRQTELYMKNQWLGNGKGKGKEREDVHQGTTIHDLPGEVLISVRHLCLNHADSRYSAICRVNEMPYLASKSANSGANSRTLSYGNDRLFAASRVSQVSPESYVPPIRHNLMPTLSDESISAM